MTLEKIERNCTKAEKSRVRVCVGARSLGVGQWNFPLRPRDGQYSLLRAVTRMFSDNFAGSATCAVYHLDDSGLDPRL